MSGALPLPKPPAAYSQQDQADLRGALIRAAATYLQVGADVDSPKGRVYLYDANGARWQLIVSTAGVLSTVAA